ncbi:hypothetical protein FGG08_006199 [Glutinoglossum americanum]|uniref:Uncharacterized protein n=1 Tax=Glutinoglossum americanum TaxID=1670608 RepID=A0A9P8I7V7_9PEZI|nr:hypothetical protein FGG08_006199 [Glutinoglossum americanum]
MPKYTFYTHTHYTGTTWHHLSNIWESATEIAGTDDIPPVQVWHPSNGNIGQGYFRQDGNPEFIALDKLVRDEPGVIAHEYGHYYHFAIMGRWFPTTEGGIHSFCQVAAQSNSDAWLEGYAMAFGLRVQNKVPVFSWTTSPEVTMRGTHRALQIQPAAGYVTSESRTAAGVRDAMDFTGRSGDPNNGEECNGGDTALGQNNKCDCSGFMSSTMCLRDTIRGEHMEGVEDWVKATLGPLKGSLPADRWLEALQYNYYLGPIGFDVSHQNPDSFSQDL